MGGQVPPVGLRSSKRSRLDKVKTMDVTPPSQDRDLLRKRQEHRYRFLRALYDATRGSTSAFLNMWELGESLDLSRQETNDVENYLGAERLLKPMALGGEISITHAGVQEVEASIERPDDDTDHFSAAVINNFTTYHGPVIHQSGSRNVANGVQNNGVSGDQLSAVLATIRRLAASLKPEERDQALELVQVVDEESRSPQPKKAMLRTALKGLKEFVHGAAELAVPLADLARVIGPLVGP
jgi:hypothetical protein